METTERSTELVAGARDALATGDSYLNFMGEEGAARIRAAYGAGNAERLARIKAEWDPDDVFKAVGHVPPAVEAAPA